MNTNTVPTSGRYFLPLWGIMFSSCSTMKATMSSRTICSLPGFSTLSRERMNRPSAVRNSTISAQKTR